MAIPAEMRNKYISRRRQDLESLRTALAGGEFAVFSRIGHQLRGNAATFGYDALAQLGEKLEKVAETHDRTEAEGCLHTLGSWIEAQPAAI